jgi:hypothetical protein
MIGLPLYFNDTKRDTTFIIVQALTQVLKTVFGYRSYFLIYQFIHVGN